MRNRNRDTLLLQPLEPGQVVKRAEPPPELRAEIEAEEREYPRPEWALGPLPDKPNGKPEEANA